MRFDDQISIDAVDLNLPETDCRKFPVHALAGPSILVAEVFRIIFTRVVHVGISPLGDVLASEQQVQLLFNTGLPGFDNVFGIGDPQFSPSARFEDGKEVCQHPNGLPMEKMLDDIVG